MSNNKLDWNYHPKDDGAIEIPVRVAEATAQANMPDADEQVVREYEERYFGMPQSDAYTDVPPPQQKRKNEEWQPSGIWDKMKSFDVPPRHRYQGRRRAPQITNENDKMWAAVAHGSAILTLIAALSSGPGLIFGLLIPLGIYLFFRNRSEYVAFHALQAFTFQTVCTVGMVSVVVALGLLTILSLLASFLLVGIPFLLFFGFAFLTMIFVAAFVILFVMPVYGASAAFSALNGRNFRYPWVADWVDDQLTNGVTPAGTFV